jgi:type I restriction enzyme S subunit
MNNIKTAKLGEIADFRQYNFDFKEVDFINYLDTSSITENKISNFQKLNINTDTIPSRAKKFVKKNTIIYSSVRPNLKHYGIVKNPVDNMVVSTGFVTFNPNGNVNADYLYYAITQQKYTDRLHTIATNSVSAYPSINPRDLESLEVEIIPDLPTQTRIAAVLSCLDEKIALNNRINDNLPTLDRSSASGVANRADA